MKIGARIFKTGLAVVLALMLSELFNLPSPVFAAISAVFAIQPSIYRSYLTIIEQVQGNVVGALVAIIFGMYFGNHFIIVGLAAMIVIMINLRLKIDTISLSVVTLIVIMGSPADEFLTFALLRFVTIMLGIFSAFLINLIFIPPKYETKLYTSISEITNEILKWIRITNENAAEQTLLKKEIESIKEKLIKVDQTYLLYKEERTFLRKDNLSKMRKLVIYRQMIVTAKAALDILKKLRQYDQTLIHLDETINQQIHDKLNQLINNHEHLLLRYIGKAIQIHDEEMQEYDTNKEELLLLFNHLQEKTDNHESLTQIFQFIASIMDYNEQLERLEILQNNIEQTHKDAEAGKIPD